VSATGQTLTKHQHSLGFSMYLCRCVWGRLVSFQVTVLKVLAGHPAGRASLDELRRAVVVLMSSGTDWTARTRQMAARAPDLNIFGQLMVLRDGEGWQITDAGRALLASIEGPVPIYAAEKLQPFAATFALPALPPPITPPTRLIALDRRDPRRRVRTRTRPSAVA
jgi:hypothetical protein